MGNKITIKDSIGKEKLYHINEEVLVKEPLFSIISKEKGVKAYELAVEVTRIALNVERAQLYEQFCSELARIEFYVNNAGWDTDERRDKEIETIWGIRDKIQAAHNEALGGANGKI